MNRRLIILLTTAFLFIVLLVVAAVFNVKLLLFFTTALFLLLLGYYSMLTIAGLYNRLKGQEIPELAEYPSVDILIPAHNEGVVIQDTIEAMTRLNYPGNLQIYVLNDNSSDETGDIAEDFAATFTNVHHILVPPGEPKGKSRVLNYGLSISGGTYYCVYDADNQPDPEALVKLVAVAESNPKSAGAVGYVRTVNEQANWLTRMISIEFQVFQLLMQSGRWQLFKTGSLTGTNMLVRRSVIEELGGYDPYAIAEDAELTLRITKAGYYLPIVPDSITWEQEPETLGVYLKQRTRWLQGNLYIVEKTLTEPGYFKGKLLVHSIHQLLVYVVFWLFLVISYIWFILGLLDIFYIEYTYPLLFIWYLAYIVYTTQLFAAQATQRTFTPLNVFISVIMYFTYAQLFSYLFVRSLILYVKAKKNRQIIGWDKTERFKQK
ncbi:MULTISPECIES: glycosyltransferase family 2 protein [Sporosarcina]|uniref:glycosyltransferase family 2 protein n=1 Tax=Sporosarcina TaxID=1569 RepID=UPI00058EF17D|nr:MULTISPECIES: glycosyltransferase [Sporosarcina]WJY26605.1 glycosyltransferase [Sporosarcina sp. 0.2-SM1T-5]